MIHEQNVKYVSCKLKAMMNYTHGCYKHFEASRHVSSFDTKYTNLADRTPCLTQKSFLLMQQVIYVLHLSPLQFPSETPLRTITL